MNTKDNKYQTWYNSLVERARNRAIEGYVERHHIIPKSLGGTDEPSNIVALTAREHLIAHMLLPRFVEQPGKMWCTLWTMMNIRKLKRRVGSKMYERVKIEQAVAHSACMKGRPNPGVSAALKGRKFPDRSAAMKGKPNGRKGIPVPKISAALKGRKRPGLSAIMKGRPSPLKGRPRSEETKAKVSAALKGRKQAPWAVEIRRQRIIEYYAKKKQSQALLSHSPN